MERKEEKSRKPYMVKHGFSFDLHCIVLYCTEEDLLSFSRLSKSLFFISLQVFLHRFFSTCISQYYRSSMFIFPNYKVAFFIAAHFIDFFLCPPFDITSMNIKTFKSPRFYGFS